jgi:hypothetical protein
VVAMLLSLDSRVLSEEQLEALLRLLEVSKVVPEGGGGEGGVDAGEGVSCKSGGTKNRTAVAHAHLALAACACHKAATWVGGHAFC